MTIRFSRFLALTVALITLSGTAHAGLITSVDRATFQAAVTGGTIAGQDFDGLADLSILGTLGGVTYSASAGSVIVTDRYLTSTSPHGIGSTSFGGAEFFLPTESATFSFASAITAFAIDINTFADIDGAYTSVLSTGDIATSIFEVFPSTATGQFLGFVSDTAFTSITLSATSGFSYTLDTLVYGDAAAVIPSVPEPSMLILLALGLFGLAYSQRKSA